VQVQAVLFGITAVLALAGGVGVIASRRPVYSALALLLVLLCLSVDYLLLDAQFIAVLQVIIYAGAIVVLFVFIIMLLHARSGEGPGAGAGLPVRVAAGLCALFGLGLIAVVVGTRTHPAAVPADFGTVQDVGRSLLTRYLLPFEAASVILLIGMIGAVALGKRLPARDTRPVGPEGRP
jgi:NADH-quinone oxidoreductase subunit J